MLRMGFVEDVELILGMLLLNGTLFASSYSELNNEKGSVK